MTPHLVVMTGAGISADSGVRTFRDSGGLWKGHRPEDVATPEAWHRDAHTVWRFYQERRAQMAEVAPNAAHAALARLEQRCAARGWQFTLVTQNVDDLHERAGSHPLHMHGELAVLRCERCGHRIRDLERVDPTVFATCGKCSSPRMRPDIVWFGEVPFHLTAIESALLECTHFVAIGTSGTVWPAAGMLHTARRRGAMTFVQALDPPDNLVAADRFHAGRAKDAVPAMLAELEAVLDTVLDD